jgi:predicted RNA-binding protein with PUA-like domain
MSYWLIKTEPEVYGWETFAKDKKTVWDGVENALALKHMRTMKKGDLCLYYHTGDERRIMGVAEVVSGAYPDPKQTDPKFVVVDVKVKSAFKSPVALPAIRADPTFVGWDLLRIGRLSVVPTSEAIFKRVVELGKGA